jgi:alpha-tubulin suppressor-like RCC1 family protein
MLAAFSAIPAVAANYSVMSWGFNNDGELGNGTVQTASPNGTDIPGPVRGLLGVVAIAAGGTFGMALKSDGTVWAWGFNNTGQLGNGTVTSSDVPVQVSGLTGIVAIAAGTDHGLALKSDGTIWAWGDNADGELGNYPFTLENTDTPVQVGGVSGVASIAAGDSFSMALKTDGTVWTWGINSYGNLGNGTFEGTSYMPGQVTGLTGCGGHRLGRPPPAGAEEGRNRLGLGRKRVWPIGKRHVHNCFTPWHQYAGAGERPGGGDSYFRRRQLQPRAEERRDGLGLGF